MYIRTKATLVESLMSSIAARAAPDPSLWQLVAEPIGMCIGRGLIQTPSMRTPRLHYFSYDAGRKVHYDRGGEVTLLESEDLTEAGSKELFYRKIAVDGKVNLGWIDLRA